MTDSTKPITPEFVRGWLACAELAKHAPAVNSAVAKLRDWLSDWLMAHKREVDPLAAAKERLGRWLCAEDVRHHIKFDPSKPNAMGKVWHVDLYDYNDGYRSGRGRTEAEAIMAALDAAGAEK